MRVLVTSGLGRDVQGMDYCSGSELQSMAAEAPRLELQTLHEAWTVLMEFY